MAQADSATDFVIIGAGILGLSIAAKIKALNPDMKIAVLEKESCVGLHASGRNSGVLHSGIYYPSTSLKAAFCAQGARLMRQYCQEHGLPCKNIGKVIVPTRQEDAETLSMLFERGHQNGVKVSYIDEKQLGIIEPLTRTVTGHALFVEETAVVDPKGIVQHLFEKLQKQGVVFYFNATCKHVNTSQKTLYFKRESLSYRHLINTAGLYADKIAEVCGIKNKYTMLPFKGLYYELSAQSSIQINHLIYPVPDMNVPFLGVHFTKTVDGKIYVGPTAIPALGREQYRGLSKVRVGEATSMIYHLLKQYQLDHQGFRSYAHHEVSRFLKSYFVKAAQLLVPSLKSCDLVRSEKVGIRAQLLNKQSRELVMDFLIEETENETHILNAVSPAFTSAFSFSDNVVQKIQAKLELAA